jgi:hypothetical protein
VDRYLREYERVRYNPLVNDEAAQSRSVTERAQH